jgi:hypothetical protein
MRSLGTYTAPETVGLNFQRFSIPTGHVMPRAPKQGEMFVLLADLSTNTIPWFAAGIYVNDGTLWVRIDHPRTRKAEGIGPQRREIEKAVDVKQLPVAGTGICLGSVAIAPATRRGGMSGMASFTVEHEKSCHMLTTVFRDKRPVGFVVSQLEAHKSQHISISFVDNPNSRDTALYTLEVAVGAVGMLDINQTSTHTYDGYGQTAFIVEENV